MSTSRQISLSGCILTQKDFTQVSQVQISPDAGARPILTLAYQFWCINFRLLNQEQRVNLQRRLKKSRLRFYHFEPILSWKISLEQWHLRLLPWTSLSFGGCTITPNPQCESRKIGLCGYHHPNIYCTSPWNGSIFKDLQQKLINSIQLLLFLLLLLLLSLLLLLYHN